MNTFIEVKQILHPNSRHPMDITMMDTFKLMELTVINYIWFK